MSTLLIKFKLIQGRFEQSNIHFAFDFCPRTARKETNVPQQKINKELTVLIYLLCLKELTRTNEKITSESISKFIDGLDVTDDIKQELKNITPFNFTGVQLI